MLIIIQTSNKNKFCNLRRKSIEAKFKIRKIHRKPRSTSTVQTFQKSILPRSSLFLNFLLISHFFEPKRDTTERATIEREIDASIFHSFENDRNGTEKERLADLPRPLYRWYKRSKASGTAERRRSRCWRYTCPRASRARARRASKRRIPRRLLIPNNEPAGFERLGTRWRRCSSPRNERGGGGEGAGPGQLPHLLILVRLTHDYDSIVRRRRRRDARERRSLPRH